MVERHSIAYHEKTARQLFCDVSSKDILAMLVHECEQANVTIRTHCDISVVRYADGYHLETSSGAYAGQSLVVATGGLSIPKMGASDFVIDSPGSLISTFCRLLLAWFPTSSRVRLRSCAAAYQESARLRRSPLATMLLQMRFCSHTEDSVDPQCCSPQISGRRALRWRSIFCRLSMCHKCYKVPNRHIRNRYCAQFSPNICREHSYWS